jgi:hypothetical protein
MKLILFISFVLSVNVNAQFTIVNGLGSPRSAPAAIFDSYIMTHRSDAVTGGNHDGTKIIQIGNYIYSFGGWVPGASNNEIHRAAYPFTTWESRGTAPWSGRHTFGIGKIGSTVFVWGGDHINPAADCWSSTDGETWTQLATSAWPVRTIYGACVYDNKLWIMGGQTTDLLHTTSFYDVYSSPDGVTWTQQSNSSGNSFLWKNLAGSVCSFNGKIHQISGGDYPISGAPQYGDQSHRTTTDGVTWTTETNVPFTGKQYVDCIEWDGKLWVICGYRFANTKDIWYMNTDGSWHSYIAHDDFLPRHATGIATFDDGTHNCLVLTNGNYHDDCWTIEKQ